MADVGVRAGGEYRVRNSLMAVWVDHVDVENGASGGLVDAGGHNLW
jgi:hypothetical protein